MVAAFERIGADPMCGRSRELFGAKMQSLPYEKHNIFFAPIEAAGGEPVILRIVHRRRHLPALIYYDGLDAG